MKGKILGSRYKVLEYIAQGGFGTTYLAEDTQLPRKDRCVIKQLSPGIQDANFLEIARRLFKTEASALHNLGNHDRIPALLAYFEEEEKFYLAQQYIEGETLREELDRDRVWSESEVVELLQDCLKILEFIHSKSMIHRDLKPDNLIRRKSDRKIVLVDFGTVKNVLQGQTQIAKLTISVGTQGYMSIEQARGKPQPASDIYALGIIGIEILTKIEPLEIEEDEEGELRWKHLADISPNLAEILTKMTRYHLKDRYQSAEEVFQDLDALENPSLDATQDVHQDDGRNLPQPPTTNPLPSNAKDSTPITIIRGTAISEEYSDTTSSSVSTDLQNDTTESEADSRANIQSLPNAVNQPVRPVQHQSKGVGKMAIAMGILVISGGLFFLMQFVLQSRINPQTSPSNTPRVEQGEGFRKGL